MNEVDEVCMQHFIDHINTLPFLTRKRVCLHADSPNRKQRRWEDQQAGYMSHFISKGNEAAEASRGVAT